MIELSQDEAITVIKALEKLTEISNDEPMMRIYMNAPKTRNQPFGDLITEIGHIQRDLNHRITHEVRSNIRTHHCKNCDSSNLLMINAALEWDVDKQKWEETDSNYSEGYLYQCNDCYEDHVDVVVKRHAQKGGE